jgi:hypothetical protein
MSGGTTRHRRPSRHLVEIPRPKSWDDDDEATRFYQRASAPPAPPLPYEPDPDPALLDIADYELTSLLPRLVEPRRPTPRPVLARQQSARERVVTPIGVQRRDHQPRLVEAPLAEVTQVVQPRRRDAARVAPPRPPRAPRTTPAPRVQYEYEPPPQPPPQFSAAPMLVPNDYLAREFGRPRRRRAGVPLAFCLLVGGLSFLAARAWHSGPAAGTAVVATTPADARVFVDGRELTGQMSPFKLAGLDVATEHLIEVSKPGFISQTRRVRIEAGDVRVLPGIELEAGPPETGVALGSIPSGAAILLDDRRLPDVTPARLVNLTPGIHRIRLERADFQPWATSVEVAAGQVHDLPIAHLRAQRGAGASRNARPPSPRRSGRAGWHARATSEPDPADETDEPSLAPTPQGPDGTLRINSLPWAEVFIDERSIGTTPQLAIPLAPGRHKVRLVNPDLAIVKGFTVDIQPGKTLTKLVQMVE